MKATYMYKIKVKQKVEQQTTPTFLDFPNSLDLFLIFFFFSLVSGVFGAAFPYSSKLMSPGGLRAVLCCSISFCESLSERKGLISD
jgi:hypothetical protein